MVLTHGNLWYQTTTMQHMMEVSAGQTSMIQLPLWHIYQRLVGYHQHYRATRVVSTWADLYWVGVYASRVRACVAGFQ